MHLPCIVVMMTKGIEFCACVCVRVNRISRTYSKVHNRPQVEATSAETQYGGSQPVESDEAQHWQGLVQSVHACCPQRTHR